MKPTYEQLEQRCQDLEQRCRDLEKRNRQLEDLLKKALDRIVVLEERLNQNSDNSSKPPSTDSKSNNQTQNKKRRSHKGVARSLLPLEQVDFHEVCLLDQCPHCGSKALLQKEDPILLQQVDLPEVQGVVTQFDRHKYQCTSCKSHSLAPLPKGVPNSAFGPRLMALVGSLTGVFHLSKDDAKQLVLDLYNIEISDGSVINIEERITAALRPVYDRIHRFVTESVFCKHFDETSWRDRGLTHYVWVAGTKQAVCYRIDRYRSQKAFLALASKLNQAAPVTTDRYPVYNSVKNPHQFCIPHLIRNFRRFSQRDGPDGKMGEEIVSELQFLCHTHSDYRKKKISKASCSQSLRWCRERLGDFFLDALVSGSKQLGDLCQKLLLDDFEKLWMFQQHPDTEPSNNLAERDLRKVVLWRKKSYGTRSDRGKRFVETISSVAATLRRSNVHVLNFLTDAVTCLYRGDDAPRIRSTLGF